MFHKDTDYSHFKQGIITLSRNTSEPSWLAHTHPHTIIPPPPCLQSALSDKFFSLHPFILMSFGETDSRKRETLWQIWICLFVFLKVPFGLYFAVNLLLPSWRRLLTVDFDEETFDVSRVLLTLHVDYFISNLLRFYIKEKSWKLNTSGPDCARH